MESGTMAEFDNQQIDPYLCNSGASKRFWRETFKTSSDCLFRNCEDRARDSATLGKLKPQMLVSVGDRVTVDGRPGSVKFVGFVDDTVVAPLLRVGIKLDESVHLGHDGMYNGKRYFYCTNGHGIMVRYRDVVPLRPPNKRPPVKGNPMFPSWPDICKRRKQRDMMLEEMEKKNNRTPVSSVKTPRPPAISPRENRAVLLRREMTSMGRVHDSYLIVQDDPYDIAYKDHQQKKKRDMLVASMSAGDSDSSANWERGLMQQWRRKYDDPDKASRMGETLLKLCSAYKEGIKLKDVHAD